MRKPPRGLLRGGEAVERVAVERVGLPGRLVPLAVLVSDDRDGHDDAVAAQMVGRGDAVVELPFGADRELDGAREVVVPKQLELVIAGVRAERSEERRVGKECRSR